MTRREIKIVEVGPRDGLQNEQEPVDTTVKIHFIEKLAESGIQHIEVSSFVDPRRIPQLADAEQVFAGLHRRPGVHYTALVPNQKGMERALTARTDGVAVFTATSETFCQKNINCSIEESLKRFQEVVDTARQNHIPVRAYVSCVLGCPYEGFIKPDKVADVAARLYSMGCAEISLGDTIGAGTPAQARNLIDTVSRDVPIERLAVHFHDTRGQALANILACLELGVTTVDSSVAGLGGCPYARGATGNVATEDVVYMLHGMGYDTGIDLEKLILVGHYINLQLKRTNSSRVGVAGVPYDYASYETTV
jgi:hydroxymethylglutaryl-CoA lyase